MTLRINNETYNGIKTINKRCSVLLQKEKAFLCIDGKPISSYTPFGFEAKWLNWIIIDDFEKHGVKITDKEASAAASYMVKGVRV